MNHLFSYILMGLMFAASVSYLFQRNYPMSLYWGCAGMLNVAVLWGSK